MQQETRLGNCLSDDCFSVLWVNTNEWINIHLTLSKVNKMKEHKLYINIDWMSALYVRNGKT